METKIGVWDVWKRITRCNSLLSPFSPQGVPLPLTPKPVLLLSEVRPQDQGTYSCVATHPSHGPQESRAVSVHIIGEETSLQIPGTLGLG